MDTMFVGRHFIELKSIDSTNLYALRLIEEKKCFEGTLVSAIEQNSGKGQRGNHWISNPGENITASIIFFPSFLSAMQQFNLNKAIAVGVKDFISDFCSEDIKIKWPNDILVGNKKVAGILIENILRGNSISRAVVGIGININQTNFTDLPSASSIKLSTGIDYDITNCIESLCKHIEKRYLQLKSGSSMINEEYLKNLYQLNKWCIYEVENKLIKARIKGVSEFGRLIVEYEDGNFKEFDLKELKFVL